MQRTTATLSDGRDIVWYDRDGAASRDTVDKRDLPPIETHSQLRYDALLDEEVAIASHRQGRTFLPPADQCPLCPSRDGRLTEVPSDDYDVVVFENRFPSLAQQVTGVPTVAGDIFASRPGVGRCEVVCFTSDHNSSFAQLRPQQARLVIDAWADRTTEFNAIECVEQVFVFENRGEEIGVTLNHPHGQIYGYPFVTPKTRRMLESARRYSDESGDNLFAAVLAAERESGERIVAAGEHWTAFVPSAARWPMEVHLYPNRQVPDLPALDDAERNDLALVYLEVLRRMDGLYDAPMPYIAGWHQAPVRSDRDLAYLHLEVFSIKRTADKLKYLAGSESGMAVWVNDVLPESIATRLREVVL